MATENTLTAVSHFTVNALDFCGVSTTVSEEGTENDTTSSCDGEGSSMDYSNIKLILDGEAFFTSDKPPHASGGRNIRLNSVVDAEAYVGPTADDRKYTWTDAKVTRWQVTSRVKNKVMVSLRIESQGDPSTAYTVPTT